jgi:hypothetical protein
MSDETAIELELDLSIFASGPVSGSTWDTLIRIDGEEHRFDGGRSHRIPCSPGQHVVEVEFAAEGLQVFAASRGYRAGLERTTIDVAENETAKLVYRGGMFWKMGAHSLEQIEG